MRRATLRSFDIPRFIQVIASALLLATSSAFAAHAHDASTMYRCPNLDYRNNISKAEAQKLGCKLIEGEPVKVIRPRSDDPSTLAKASSPVSWQAPGISSRGEV